ncbi:unnamed protein product [Cuscuta epithymum]|uniref:Uncharacterized protein n=1 Tax=Cuscuta epithymum TaxID=186058 RepID=A0AAV0DVQ6_9ASTE|nr:unnamed protein product [Cuscuta epithymum]
MVYSFPFFFVGTWIAAFEIEEIFHLQNRVLIDGGRRQRVIGKQGKRNNSEKKRKRNGKERKKEGIAKSMEEGRERM